MLYTKLVTTEKCCRLQGTGIKSHICVFCFSLFMRGTSLCFQVNDVRLITDNKTRRSKGIAYIEFKDTESVPLAMGLTGQKLLGVPILVQPSQAEKNRMSMAPAILTSNRPINVGPMRLYVGSLHFNITEEMLKGIFEPFGKVGISRGYTR